MLFFDDFAGSPRKISQVFDLVANVQIQSLAHTLL